ncbi:MAG: phosphoglycerate kinase [Sulfolobales archaeon]
MSYKILGFYGIGDIDLSSKKILLRLDLNSPIDPRSKRISDDSRIKAHAESVKKLIEMGASIVIIAHQGRPGDSDFTTLMEHCERLSKYTGYNIEYVDDIIGPYAIKRISSLEPGEAIMLENIRFLSEEMIEAPPEAQANRIYVRKLSKYFDIYVNDAFGASHRSQPSIVGFPVVMRGVAGPIMERELLELSKAFSEESRPRIFVLGGAKVQDTVKIIRNIVSRRAADAILLTGVISLVYHMALGTDLGDENRSFLSSKGYTQLLEDARETMGAGVPIILPRDYRVLRGEAVENLRVSDLKAGGRALDIGEETIEEYSRIMRGARVIVMRGPAGYIEDERFRAGTEALLREALSSRARVIIGGGHLGSMVPEDYDRSRVLVSTGGGALLTYLSGEPLPALEALRISARRWWG